ncbi:MAG: tetratricopeptide repeat protein [Magnetococcus sp. DMHC-6]
MELDLLDRFRQTVAKHTGLVVPKQDALILEKRITERREFLGFVNAEMYLSLLLEDSQSSEREWRELVLTLTTGESYFFRDAGQMKLLEGVVLPELINREKSQKPNIKKLRIWSAGCSSGEEPYSLAILLNRLLPAWEMWQILILGSDINHRSLSMARKGEYGSWSMRSMDPEILKTYFFRHGTEWRLDEQIRKMVDFSRVNLIRDPFPDPSSELRGMDLIICRNVFIYFDEDTVGLIVDKFARTLRPGGYLMTGHAELSPDVRKRLADGPNGLVVKTYPESVIYQRPLHIESLLPGHPKESISTYGVAKLEQKFGRRAPAFSKAVSPPRPTAPDPLARWQEGQNFFGEGAYLMAIQRAEEGLRDLPGHYGLLMLMARCYANLGQIALAQTCCDRAIRADPMASSPWYLLAHLALEQGEMAKSLQLLNKTLYLDQAHVPALLELADIHRRQGELERSIKIRQTALKVLQTLPATQRLEHYEEWTVAQLIAQLQER